ncbi:MAG: ECF-type sigma factor [Phycisphaerales bacterium JB039]
MSDPGGSGLDGQTPPTTHDLVAQVYQRLRALAQQSMRTERDDHTLGPTALVHEAFLRLAEGRRIPWSGEAHFVVAAAEAMRRILVDHARARATIKRGSGRVLRLADISSVAEKAAPEEILALDDAISRLEAEDPRAAAVVRLRFFAGLPVEATARILGASERTVAREWSFARARLYELLTEPSTPAQREV